MSRILVIEDELAQRELLTAFLESDGYTVTTVGTAREGIARASQEPPDLILLDMLLPDAGWIETVKTLRTLAPIIIVSGFADQVNRRIAFAIGADDVIAKPYDSVDLLARVQAALRRRNPHPWGTPTPPPEEQP